MSHPRSTSSAHTPVYRRRTFDPTTTGVVYLFLLMFIGIAAMSSQANLLFALFGLMIGIWLISRTISKIVLRKLLVTRVMPESAVVGLPAIISYELRNAKRFWPSLSVTISELDGVDAFLRQPQAYMLHAAGRMTAIVPAQVVPRRRGLHELDRVQLSTSFPFGFMKRATRAGDRRHKESIIIYPAIGNVDPALLELMTSADRSGTTMHPRRGGNDEFYGLKEFRSGENPRYIYWRRSARVGTLVAKEMTQVAPPTILVAVDTFLPAGETARADVERCIAMATSLVSHALEAGLSVGLVAWSDGWVKISPGRGKRHRRDLLTILARLPERSGHDDQQLLAACAELRDAATTVALFTARGEGDSSSSPQGALTIASRSPQAKQWFYFGDAVDFDHCSPNAESNE